jgi:hypothetical protein
LLRVGGGENQGSGRNHCGQAFENGSYFHLARFVGELARRMARRKFWLIHAPFTAARERRRLS